MTRIFNHDNIKTYCQRPDNFTKLLVRNIQNTVKPGDTVIHDGDVFMGKSDGWNEIRKELPGTWWLIRGNHDSKHSPSWWCDHGFAFCADAMIFRGVWFTHKPSTFLPEDCMLNIHGHLHNIWNGFHPTDPGKTDKDFLISTAGRLEHPWRRLFAVEYTNYFPIEIEKFISKPNKYKARGPNYE